MAALIQSLADVSRAASENNCSEVFKHRKIEMNRHLGVSERLLRCRDGGLIRPKFFVHLSCFTSNEIIAKVSQNSTSNLRMFANDSS